MPRYVVERTFPAGLQIDAPTPGAIRRTANDDGLPVDGITEVPPLDPYFYF